jgi:hypothetical protein
MSDVTAINIAIPTAPTGATAELPDDNNGSGLLSRKFLLCALFAIVGCAALMLAKIDGVAFNWLVGIIIGGHSTANILDKKLNAP